MSKAQLDLTFGILMLVLLAIVAWIIIPIGIVVPSNIQVAALSPDFWPKTIILLAAIASILVVLQAWRDLGQPEESDDGEDRYYAFTPALIRVLATPVGILAIYYAMQWSGIVFGSMLLLAGLIFLAGERRWWLITLNAIVLPSLLYIFFVYLANIPLPLGIFEQFR